jgi:hypothetical protein
MGSTVIMGRKTWESIPERFRPLAGRRNIVVTSTPWDERWRKIGGVEPTHSVGSALAMALDQGCESSAEDVWVIGGARVYEAAMQFADVIDVTHVLRDSNRVLRGEQWWRIGVCGLAERCNACDRRGSHLEDPQDVVRFPPIDESVFAPGPIEPHPDEPTLTIQRFERRYGLKDNQKLQEQGSLRRSR